MRFACLVREALTALSERRPVFHSEADLQHELARQIISIDPEVEMRLERPVRLSGARPIYLDAMLRRDGKQYALELKYITSKLDVTIDGEEFLLKAQSAQDLSRYDILKDITRIERLVEAEVVSGGMSVNISNERSLWQEAHRSGTLDEAFRLDHGRTITGSLGWGDGVGVGTARGREAALNIAGSYTLDWVKYSEIEAPKNGDFRMLIAEINAPGH